MIHLRLRHLQAGDARDPGFVPGRPRARFSSTAGSRDPLSSDGILLH